MMGKSLFTGMIALFWVAEATFAAVVVYWFVTQGFSEDRGVLDSTSIPLEDRATTRKSLLAWGGFFAFIVLMIVIGA